MSYLAPSKRAAVRASMAFRSVGPSARPAFRSFTDSKKDKAVHAATQPSGQQLGGMAPEFMPAQGKAPGPAVTPAPLQVPRAVPVPPLQLNVLEQAHKPEFYKAVSRIMEHRKNYIRDRHIWVPSEEMQELCRGLGAREEDFAKIQQVSEHLYFDPTLPFRKTRNGRFCFDYDTQSVRRLEFQPFALSVDEDFKRYDSGQIRRFDEIEDDLQLNTVLQALLVFKGMLLHEVACVHRPKLDYEWNKYVLTLFSLRTFTNENILGEPALEGVHSDGVDHTMTTFLGSSNMRGDSAATFMHAMEEKTGSSLNESKPENIRARVQHTRLLDTLVLVDHENKHSLSPVYQEDMTKDATRDMLVFFTRKPVEKDHISGKIDSLNPHQEKRMEIPMFLPRTQ